MNFATTHLYDRLPQVTGRQARAFMQQKKAEIPLALGRLFGAAAVILAALSTAWADVREIGPPEEAADVDFPRYANRDVSDPWLEVLLRRTWLEIWIEMLRDEIFVDTSDSLTKDEFAAELRSLTLSGPNSIELDPVNGAWRTGAGCASALSSASVRCEITSDLASSGWTNPYSTSTQSSSSGPAGWSPVGQGAEFGGGAIFPGGYSSTAALQQLIGALADLTPPGSWLLDQNDSQSGATLGASEPPLTLDDPSPPPVTGQSGGPPAVPESSIPAMLLTGLCAIALALLTRKGSSRRSVA